jgi:CubicO group peptidase (beta-lactamase class C family)
MQIKVLFLALTSYVCMAVSSSYCQPVGQRPADLAADQLKALTDKAVAPLLAGKGALRGLVVGVVHGDRKEVWGYGKVGKKGEVPDGKTLFPIFSVTKPLTALLLAQSSVEGQLSYDDVAIRLKGKAVTYRHLVTHTSGLPTLVFGNFTVESLRRYLAEFSPTREPGSQFAYSRVGYDVLGMRVAQKCGSDAFESCLAKRILAPIGMTSTVFQLSKSGEAHFAGAVLPERFKEGQNPDCPSNGLISSADDLVRLVSANLHPQSYPDLEKAILATQQIPEPETRTFPGCVAALGWQVIKPSNFYWHSGVGSGRAFVAFDRKSKSGIVILTDADLFPFDTRIEFVGFDTLAKIGAIASPRITSPADERASRSAK